MASTTLIAANPELGADIAQSRDWGDAEHLHIDPIEYVSTVQLLALAFERSYADIHGEIETLTPDQPDVDDWDVENLFAYVCRIPDEYHNALADVRDYHLSDIADNWGAIEELQRMPLTAEDLAETIACIRKIAVTARSDGLSLLLFMTP